VHLLCRYWSLKEAYVKAMGSGLIEGLNKVEFSHTNWSNISATMDGKFMALWRFWLIELGERHCVSSLLTFIWVIIYILQHYRGRGDGGS